MSDTTNAQTAPDGASPNGLCEVQQVAACGMITLRADLGDPAVAQTVQAVTGCDMPGPLSVTRSGALAVAWMAPDEMLLICPPDDAGRVLTDLTSGLGDLHALAVDVSDARAVFDLRGAALREVIAKVAPLDMSPAAFGPGSVRRTRFAQVAAAVWMVEADRAQVVCFRSVAPYMRALLDNAAAPGTGVGVF